MRRWRTVGICGLLILTCASIAVWNFQRPKWNVLIVTLDTTRADHLGCYGHTAAHTPHLDLLAQNGVVFERAYAPAPLTLPSHATMFTGLYPPEHSLRTNGQGRLPDSVPTLAEVLAANGYATGGFVASFVLDSKFGLERGFSRYGDDLTGAAPADHALHRFRAGNVVVDEALQWLTGNFGRPFFCWVHLYDPHSPYLTHPDLFGDRFVDHPYDAEIAFVDQQLGRLQTFLQQRGIADRTLVIVVGDHGEGLGEHNERKHGKMIYNSTLHVPLIVSMPGILPKERRVSSAVSLVDVFPTVLNAVGIAHQSPGQSRSLLPEARREPVQAKLCYSETDEPFHEAGWSPLRSLTTDRWKYIRAPRPELYDLAKDGSERHNLAATQPQQMKLMEQQLADLESNMVPLQRDNIELSAREQRTLASLGYVANSAAAPAIPHSALPDIKDMMVHYNELDDVHDLLDAGKVDVAIERLKKLAVAAPGYEMPQVILGDALTRRKDFDAAVAQFRAILKRNPDSEMAYSHLGDALAAQGRFAEAVNSYQESLSRDPDSDGLRYNLGKALVQLGKVREAIPHFEAALDLDPGFTNAYVELGSALLREGRADEALENYQAALKHNSQSLEAHMNSVSVLAAQGRYAEAQEHLELSLQIAPDDPNIHYGLGAILAAEGHSTQAIQHLKAALRLRPDYPAAQTLLKTLEAQHR